MMSMTAELRKCLKQLQEVQEVVGNIDPERRTVFDRFKQSMMSRPSTMSIAELGGHLQELKSAFMDDQLVNEDEYKGLIEAVRDSFRKEPVVPEVAPMR